MPFPNSQLCSFQQKTLVSRWICIPRQQLQRQFTREIPQRVAWNVKTLQMENVATSFFFFFFPAIKNVISDVAPLRCLQKSWVIISTTWSYWASSVGDQKRSSFLAMDKTAGHHSSAFMSRVVVGVVERHSKVIYWASSSSSCQNQSSVYVCVIFKSISAALADKMSLCVVMWLDF